MELRDGDKSKYLGKSVHKAVANVNEKIAIALVGMDPTQQAQIDKLMIDLDKTENKVLFPLIVYLSFLQFKCLFMDYQKSLHKSLYFNHRVILGQMQSWLFQWQFAKRELQRKRFG